jgi:hypothetical protein
MLLVLDDGMPQNLELNPIIFGKTYWLACVILTRVIDMTVN